MPLMRRNSDVYQRRIDDKEAGKAVYVVAVYDYGPKVETFCNDGTDLAMAIGDLVEVTDAKLAETGGWWAGINVRTKDTGIFPTNYVGEASPSEVQSFMANLHNEQQKQAEKMRERRKKVQGKRQSAQPAQPRAPQAKQGKGAPPSSSGGGGEKTKTARAPTSAAVKATVKRRPTGGSSSRTRLGIYSSNLVIYSCVLWALFGFAHLLSAANGFSPWLHECWDDLDGGLGPLIISSKVISGNSSANVSARTITVEEHSPYYGCKRPYQTMDTLVALYSMVIGAAIATYENLKGWERDGTVKVPLLKAFAYIALGVPGVLTMPTLLAVVFLYCSVLLNWRAGWECRSGPAAHCVHRNYQTPRLHMKAPTRYSPACSPVSISCCMQPGGWKADWFPATRNSSSIVISCR